MKQKILQLIAAFMISFIVGMPISFAFSITDVSSRVIDDTNTEVNWTTSVPATSKVNYGVADPPSATKFDETLKEDHSLVVGGLMPGQDYVYEVVSENASSHEVKDDNNGNYYKFKTYETVEITGLSIMPVSDTGDYVFYKLNWTTNIPTDGKVVYGNQSDNLTEVVTGAGNTQEHVIEVKMTKGMTYYYYVQSSYKRSRKGSVDVPFDVTPPEIDIDNFDEVTKKVIQAGSTNNASFLIKGTVEANATVDIFRNMGSVANIETNETGEFGAIVFVRDGLNRFEVKVSDLAGNSASFFFNVTADITPPRIVLTYFENSTIDDTTVINGTVSEYAIVEVSVNSVGVYKTPDYVLNFSVQISLQEDVSNITITATDRAGNVGKLEKVIGMIGPPVIRLTAPMTVEGQKEVIVNTNLKYFLIKGFTSPETQVLFYVKLEGFNDPTEPLFNVSTDYTGNFEKEIRVLNTKWNLEEFLEKKDPNKYIGGTLHDVEVYLKTHNETITYVKMVAIDKYGRVSEQNMTVKFIAKKCGKPGMFSVQLIPDTHTFMPYRLRDGIEILTLGIQLFWKGYTENYIVESVRIEPRPIILEEWKNVSKYKCYVEGKVFPGTVMSQASNDNATFHHIMYKLNPWEELNQSVVDDWHEAFKALVNNQCNIPMQIRIRYRYPMIIPTDPYTGEEPGQYITEEQVACVETSNLIERELDHTKVIPARLLHNSIVLLEATYDFLEAISPWITNIYYVASGLCLIYTGAYFVKHVKTNSVCTVAASSGEEEDAKKCTDAIQEEKKVYNHYRLACDRVLCKTTPVNPKKRGVESIPVDVNMMREIRPKNNKCKPTDKYVCVKDITQAREECGFLTKVPDQKDVYTGMPGDPEFFPTSDCNKDNGKENENWCCIRNDYAERNIREIRYSKETDAMWYPKFDKDSPTNKLVLVDQNWNYGKWAGYGGETKEIVDERFYFTGKRAELKEELGRKLKNTSVEYYVEGLHATSCFNKGRVGVSNSRTYFEPTQNFFSAVQCGCVSQINGYVIQYKELTRQMLQCLKEVEQGGSFTAAACRELFTMFICDLINWIVVEFFMSKVHDAVAKNKVGGDHSAGEGAMAGVKSFGGLFKEDYGDSFRGRFDLGVSSLTHAICMGAIFGEWDPNLQSALGIGGKTPPRQSDAWISTADRTLLGYNPITGSATFEYRMGVWLTAGSDLLNYRIELLCDYEGDCPSVDDTLAFRTTDGRFPGIEVDPTQIEQNSVSQPGGVMIVNNKFLRYNKIRVCWTSSAGPEFHGCETQRIKSTSEMMFGCGILPSTAPSGNLIYGCQKLVTDHFAEFRLPPPAEHSVSVTENGQSIKIPFDIRTEYGDKDPYQEPFLLVFKEKKGEELLMAMNPERLMEGLSSEADYSVVFRAMESDFSQQLEKAELNELKSIGSGGCVKKDIKKKGITGEGDVEIDWRKETIKFTGASHEKEIYSENKEIKEGDTVSKNKVDVVIRFNGATFEIRVTKGAYCKVTTKPAVQSIEKRARKFHIGLYTSRPGSPDDPGAVIVRPGNKKQEYEVTVTLNNDIGEEESIGGIEIGPDDAKVDAGGSVLIVVKHTQNKKITSVELRMLKGGKTVAGTSAGHIFDQKQVKIDYEVKLGLASGYYKLEIRATDNESKTLTETINVAVGDVEEDDEGPGTG